MLELDHVLIAVGDLAAGAEELLAVHGLASVEGGRHPGWGTANRIVPLGDTYLELIAVVDADEAAGSAFGRWVAAARGPFAWAVRTDDLDAFAERHGLDVGGGSRTRPDGSTLRWRLAGVERAAADPLLPFVIEWAPGTEHPGRTAVDHPACRVGLAGVRLQGEAARLEEWLGPHELPVTVAPGAPAVRDFVLA
ncbi:MAG TPA: VOC family protein [Gaiellaceae bacterium]|nr:VOC family protein [Gaiellaceae bacterium]